MANTDQNPQPDTAFPTLNSTALNAVNAQVTSLAAQLGYDGSLTVGALEDEIRFYQRRSVEALLAVGTRLLLLREMTPHGEFMSRVELLGFSTRTAQRFMQAALKTAKSANLAHLANQVSNAGKFLELVTLDDDNLDELANGGSIAGVTLDVIDTMSASELKKALREAKADLTAREKVMAEKTERLNSMAVELAKSEKPTRRVQTIDPIDIGNEIRSEVMQLAGAAEVSIRALRAGLVALGEHTAEHGVDHGQFSAGLLCQLDLAVNQLRGEFGIGAAPDGEAIPDWLRNMDELTIPPEMA